MSNYRIEIVVSPQMKEETYRSKAKSSMHALADAHLHMQVSLGVQPDRYKVVEMKDRSGKDCTVLPTNPKFWTMSDIPGITTLYRSYLFSKFQSGRKFWTPVETLIDAGWFNEGQSSILQSL